MTRLHRGLPILALACLVPTPGLSDEPKKPAAPEARQAGEVKPRVLSGRITDGLGRPVPGVTLTLRPIALDPQGREKPPLAVLSSDADGRYSCPLPPDAEGLQLHLDKEGYSNLAIFADEPRVKDVTLDRKLDWGEAQLLPVSEGAELDAGVREVLASEEWSHSDETLQKFLFEEHAAMRPAMRRLVGDAHVGKSARYWLDMLGDPADADLFPGGRKSAPKHEIREADLVEAIKAIARKLHFFSSAPEPKIDVGFIAFNRKMDHALVQCWINAGPFTGILWRFVFVKEGPRWVLRSMQEAGRG
jgi:hypothetical protein